MIERNTSDLEIQHYYKFIGKDVRKILPDSENGFYGAGFILIPEKDIFVLLDYMKEKKSQGFVEKPYWGRCYELGDPKVEWLIHRAFRRVVYPAIPSGAQILLDLIFDRTIAWGKLREAIPMSHFTDGMDSNARPNGLNMSESSIRSNIKWLKDNGFITVESARSIIPTQKEIENNEHFLKGHSEVRIYGIDFNNIQEMFLTGIYKNYGFREIEKDYKKEDNIKQIRKDYGNEKFSIEEDEMFREKKEKKQSTKGSENYREEEEKVSESTNFRHPKVSNFGDKRRTNIQKEEEIIKEEEISYAVSCPEGLDIATEGAIEDTKDMNTRQLLTFENKSNFRSGSKKENRAIKLLDDVNSLLSDRQRNLKKIAKNSDEIKINANTVGNFWNEYTKDRYPDILHAKLTGKQYSQLKIILDTLEFPPDTDAFKFFEFIIDQWQFIGSEHFSWIAKNMFENTGKKLSYPEYPDIGFLLGFKKYFMNAFNNFLDGHLVDNRRLRKYLQKTGIIGEKQDRLVEEALLKKMDRQKSIEELTKSFEADFAKKLQSLETKETELENEKQRLNNERVSLIRERQKIESEKNMQKSKEIKQEAMPISVDPIVFSEITLSDDEKVTMAERWLSDIDNIFGFTIEDVVAMINNHGLKTAKKMVLG